MLCFNKTRFLQFKPYFANVLSNHTLFFQYLTPKGKLMFQFWVDKLRTLRHKYFDLIKINVSKLIIYVFKFHFHLSVTVMK